MEESAAAAVAVDVGEGQREQGDEEQEGGDDDAGDGGAADV